VLSLKETVIYFGGGQIDRFFGSIFGLFRGFIIIIILSILASMTALPGEEAWNSAISKPILEKSVKFFVPFLPVFIKEKVFTQKKQSGD
jgi:membrane protein required for colicin V production